MSAFPVLAAVMVLLAAAGTTTVRRCGRPATDRVGPGQRKAGAVMTAVRRRKAGDKEATPMRAKRDANEQSPRSMCYGVALVLLMVTASCPAVIWAQDDAELARKTQNPVADLISVPFQNNLNFGVGPNDDVQYILNIQPVIPFHLTRDWNLISRTIMPLVYQPELAPGFGDVLGLGDIQQSLFLSPARPGKLIWGVGPIFQFPSATDDALGQGKWGAGPTAVALSMYGPWVFGALINNVWSFAGDDDRPDVNQMLIQPFVNYNLPDAWYVGSAPIITANWEADSDDRWTVPLGGHVGKIVRLGKLPVNLQAGGYYNVVRPDNAAEWQLRIQIQFLFPR